MRLYAPTRDAACPACQRANVLVDAITTTAKSLFCLACANLFAIDPSSRPDDLRAGPAALATMAPPRASGTVRGPTLALAPTDQGGAVKRG